MKRRSWLLRLFPSAPVATGAFGYYLGRDATLPSPNPVGTFVSGSGTVFTVFCMDGTTGMWAPLPTGSRTCPAVP